MLVVSTRALTPKRGHEADQGQGFTTLGPETPYQAGAAPCTSAREAGHVAGRRIDCRSAQGGGP